MGPGRDDVDAEMLLMQVYQFGMSMMLMQEPVLHDWLPEPSEIPPLLAAPDPAPVQQISFQFPLQGHLGASIKGLGQNLIIGSNFQM
jgi:hypothetical protein